MVWVGEAAADAEAFGVGVGGGIEASARHLRLAEPVEGNGEVTEGLGLVRVGVRTLPEGTFYPNPVRGYFSRNFLLPFPRTHA